MENKVPFYTQISAAVTTMDNSEDVSFRESSHLAILALTDASALSPDGKQARDHACCRASERCWLCLQPCNSFLTCTWFPLKPVGLNGSHCFQLRSKSLVISRLLHLFQPLFILFERFSSRPITAFTVSGGRGLQPAGLQMPQMIGYLQ
jgi:hypothetical protein